MATRSSQRQFAPIDRGRTNFAIRSINNGNFRMIRVTLFGRFTAGSDNRQMPLRDGCKAQELFAFLLLAPKHAHTREAIADVLWSDCTTEVSKAYLRKALWQLKTALEKCEPNAPPFLRLDSEWIQVHPEHSLWCDVRCSNAPIAAVAKSMCKRSTAHLRKRCSTRWGLPGRHPAEPVRSLVHRGTRTLPALVSHHVREAHELPHKPVAI